MQPPHFDPFVNASLERPRARRPVSLTRSVRLVADLDADKSLVSTWAILEGQITIVIEATSHENNRRGRRPLRVGQDESRSFSADRSRK